MRVFVYGLFLESFTFGLIDRPRVVSQFNVVRTSLIDNETTPLQVGNGNFAFNVDNTGLQVGFHLTCFCRGLATDYLHSNRHFSLLTRCQAGRGTTILCRRTGTSLVSSDFVY